MTSQHGGDEPEKQHAEPAHEGGSIETQLGHAVGILIEAHPLYGRGHDDRQKQQLRARQDTEQALAGKVVYA